MRRLGLSLLVLFAPLAAPAARASIAVGLSIDELAARSDLVAVGRVESVAAHWASDQRHIYTRVHVALTERWKGSAGAAIDLVVPGGEVDGLGQAVAGEPRFESGERLVLFVRRRGEIYQLVGLAQGKFRVEGAPGAEEALQDLSGLALAHRAPGGALSIGEHGEGAVPPLPLASLRRRVLEMLRPFGLRPSVGGAALLPRGTVAPP